MIYVSSDWHGWPLEKIQQLLDRAGFTEEDFLFVLGDVIDRGVCGVELLRWLSVQPNAQLILGNHEAFALSCDFLFEDISEESLEALTAEKLRRVELWCENGGGVTIRDLNQLLQEDPDTFEGVMEYLREAPLYETVSVGGRRFVLVHAGLGGFAAEKRLEEYTPHDLLWERPPLDTEYYPDATVVFGHTPTLYYGEAYMGKPIVTDTWICIDTGAACGLDPVLLRLDDGKIFF